MEKTTEFKDRLNAYTKKERKRERRRIIMIGGKERAKGYIDHAALLRRKLNYHRRDHFHTRKLKSPRFQSLDRHLLFDQTFIFIADNSFRDLIYWFKKKKKKVRKRHRSLLHATEHEFISFLLYKQKSFWNFLNFFIIWIKPFPFVSENSLKAFALFFKSQICFSNPSSFHAISTKF